MTYHGEHRVGISVPIRAVLTGSLTAAMTAGLLAAPALAASASTSSHTAAQAASQRAARAVKLPLSAAQMQADERLHDPAKGGTGAVTGIARSATGRPLAGVCVTAYGSASAQSAVTDSSGRFVLTGLKAGQYQLQYRSCGGSSAQFAPEWYGDSLQRGRSRTVVVTGSRLTPLEALAPVTLYPANSELGALPVAVIPQQGSNETASDPFGRYVTGPASAADLIKRLTARTGAHASQAVTTSKRGKISGVITSPSGQGLKGICVLALPYNGGQVAYVTTSKTGSYATGKLPAGKYEMVFFAQCGNTGNWLTEFYKGIFDPTKQPTAVPVKAGQTTKINVTMKEGGEISGTVTGPRGRKLYGICVSPLTNSFAGSLVFQGVSSDGVYHIRGVPPASYQLGFASCGNANYAPTLWPGTQNYSVAPEIKVGARQIIGNIDQIMQRGGIVSGTVSSDTKPATPLPGMCVFVQENNGLFDGGSANTDNNGNYSIKGLATGQYSVYFQPGCNNNANYVSENYPSNVKVTQGARTSGINGSLPPGATISGTVTSAATGKPLRGICVQISSLDGSYGFAVSAKNGTYSVDQLPVDTYQVQFLGGCGNRGSYAPQGYDNTNVLEPQNIDVTTAGQTVTGIDAAMHPGPIIAGTVTDTSGRKLNGICVFAVTPNGIEYGIAATTHGKYQITDLAPAQYQVIFSPGCGNNANLVQQAYKTPVSALTAATVSAASGTVGGISAALSPAGGISGTVRGAGGRPVQAYCMILTGVSGSARSLVGEIFVFGSKYEITGVPLGGYQVAFVPSCAGSALETQWYKDKPGPAHAATVVVRASHVTPHIDAALIPGGSIAGYVRSGAKAVRQMCVFAQNITQLAEFGSGFSNHNGYYRIPGLNSGDYELFFQPCGNPANAYAAVLGPQLVHVTAPKKTGGVVTDVPLGATISGTVLAGSPTAPAAGACIEAIQADGAGFGESNAAIDGTYSITNLPPGNYQVLFGDPGCSYSDADLATQWYQDKTTEPTATLVPIATGSKTALTTATLVTDGSISGTVTASGGGALGGVCVAATPTGFGTVPVYTSTAANGTYSVVDLQPGSYKVQFSSGCGAAGYKTQWWNDKPTRAAANVITVTAATATTGIGAALHK
jgi:Carboxypeptidase regulatory-like domain